MTQPTDEAKNIELRRTSEAVGGVFGREPKKDELMHATFIDHGNHEHRPDGVMTYHGVVSHSMDGHGEMRVVKTPARCDYCGIKYESPTTGLTTNVCACCGFGTVRTIENNSRPAPAPQTTEVEQLLHSYHCAYAVDANGDGMPLVDVLTPRGDSDISRGRDELHLLADYLASELSDRLRLALSAPSPADQGAVAEVQGIIEKWDQIGNDKSLDDFDHYFQLTGAGAQAIGYLRSHVAAVANEARLKEAEGLLREWWDNVKHLTTNSKCDCPSCRIGRFLSPAPSPADVARDEGMEGDGK